MKMFYVMIVVFGLNGEKGVHSQQVEMQNSELCYKAVERISARGRAVAWCVQVVE